MQLFSKGPKLLINLIHLLKTYMQLHARVCCMCDTTFFLVGRHKTYFNPSSGQSMTLKYFFINQNVNELRINRRKLRTLLICSPISLVRVLIIEAVVNLSMQIFYVCLLFMNDCSSLKWLPSFIQVYHMDAPSRCESSPKVNCTYLSQKVE